MNHEAYPIYCHSIALRANTLPQHSALLPISAGLYRLLELLHVPVADLDAKAHIAEHPVPVAHLLRVRTGDWSGTVTQLSVVEGSS